MAVEKITTAATADAATCPPGAPDGRREIPDATVKGLALRVPADRPGPDGGTAKGRKTWVLRYKNLAGQFRRVTLGVYPVMKLADARRSAEKMRGEIAGGADPTADKRAARKAARAGATTPVTVADLVESYLATAEKGRHKNNGTPLRGSTLTAARWHAEKFIKPAAVGNAPLGDVKRADIQALIEELLDSDRPGSARAVRNLLRAAFNFGIRGELVERNPAALAAAPAAGARNRTLSEAEIGLLWQATETGAKAVSLAGIAASTAVVIRLVLATGQRVGEIAGVHARELDRGNCLWTLPAERAKNHRPHAVPLSPLAVALIDQAFALAGREDWSGFAFPSPHDSASPIMRSSVTGAMRRLSKVINLTPRATPHDLRRTAATMLTGERIGVSRFIVGRVLNHITETGGSAAVTATYDHHDYLPEKRRALTAWADTLQEIVAGIERPSNVVPHRALARAQLNTGA